MLAHLKIRPLHPKMFKLLSIALHCIGESPINGTLGADVKGEMAAQNQIFPGFSAHQSLLTRQLGKLDPAFQLYDVDTGQCSPGHCNTQVLLQWKDDARCVCCRHQTPDTRQAVCCGQAASVHLARTS